MSRRISILTGLSVFLPVAGALAWTPGTYPAPSKNLSVDRTQRNDVISFWHGVYQASEGFQSRMNWTGSYATTPGAEGSNSTDFIADMERRLNYFRAMSGVPATAVMNNGATVVIEGSDAHVPPAGTLKSAAAQRAALMLTMNHNFSNGSNPAFTHTPPVNATWTAVPWNAANKGNLAINTYGPDAITGYMLEEGLNGQGAENIAVGHRRWLMRASSTVFATGDIPPFRDPNDPSTRKASANVIYVFQKPAETASLAPAFVSYPSAGFFPAPLNGKFWSLTYPGANFGSASVTVQQVGGSSVPVTIRDTSFPAADPSIIWEMPAEHAARSFPADRTYQINVTGISGAGVPTSHSYQVTLVDPNRLTSDQTLSGTGAPHPTTPANYTFTPPPFAEALRVNTYRQLAVAWTETAESGSPTSVIDRTAPSYSLTSTATFGATPFFGPVAGARSFRLTHSTYTSPPDEIFELGRVIIPKVGAQLSFKYRRGYMTTFSKLAVESSSDGGVTWSQLGSTIAGTNTNDVDSSATDENVSLPPAANGALIRFRYYVTPGGSIYADENAGGFDYTTIPTGIFIDTITLTNADWLEPRKTNDLAGNATSFVLDTTTQGGPMVVGEQWHLALQTKLGNRWFPDGPLKSITPSSTPPTTPYQDWLADNPGVTGGFDDDDDGDGLANGAEFAFFTDPEVPNTLGSQLVVAPGSTNLSLELPLATLRSGVIYAAEHSESLDGVWTSVNVVVTHTGGILRAISPCPPSGRCFIRWKITLAP